MLQEVLMYLRNWFPTARYEDTFTIQDGSITLPFLQDGQYFRIIGSVFNDGLHQYTEDMGLKDETFTGYIISLAIDPAVLKIAEEIDAWQTKYGDVVASPYSSESFASTYSYSKTSGSAGEAMTWQEAFADRLSPYRKLADLCFSEYLGYQDLGYKRPFNPGWPV